MWLEGMWLEFWSHFATKGGWQELNPRSQVGMVKLVRVGKKVWLDDGLQLPDVNPIPQMLNCTESCPDAHFAACSDLQSCEQLHVLALAFLVLQPYVARRKFSRSCPSSWLAVFEGCAPPLNFGTTVSMNVVSIFFAFLVIAERTLNVSSLRWGKQSCFLFASQTYAFFCASVFKCHAVYHEWNWWLVIVLSTSVMESEWRAFDKYLRLLYAYASVVA